MMILQRHKHSAGWSIRWIRCCLLLTSLLGATFASAPSRRRPALLSRKRSKAADTRTEDHAAVSFLFDSQRTSTKPLDGVSQLPTTRVRHLAEPFVNVVQHNDDDDEMIIDLPQLLSACRNFAQAMVDVGQSLSARDMRKNIAKAERFYSSSEAASKLRSMRDILQLEHKTDVHSYDGAQLIRLGEESCAMGLLWIRRSLHFQYLMFQQLLKGLDPDSGAQFAYENSLRDFHGRILQKVYTVGLKSSSGSNRAWLAQIGGYDEDSFSREQHEATRQDLKFLVGVWGPLLAQWESIYRDLNINEKRRV